MLQQTLRGYFGIPQVRAHRALADSQVLAAVSHKLLEIAFAMPGINSWEKLMGKLPNAFGRIGDLKCGQERAGNPLPPTQGSCSVSDGSQETSSLEDICPFGQCHCCGNCIYCISFHSAAAGVNQYILQQCIALLTILLTGDNGGMHVHHQ